MPTPREDLRRALEALEGPLRFARRNDQTLLRLQGLDALAERAVAQARQLALLPGEEQSLSRLVAHARAFTGSPETRRQALDALAEEHRKLVSGEAFQDTSRLRVRSLAAHAEKAPIAADARGLSRPLSIIKGVGPALMQRLAARDLHTLGDALLYLPRRYEDRRHPTTIALAQGGQHALIQARVVSFSEHVGRKRSWELVVEDATGELSVRWFNYRPAQYRTFVQDAPVVLSGEVRLGFRGRKEMSHPDLEPGDDLDDPTSFGCIVPIYTDIEGISARGFRRLLRRVIDEATPEVDDFHTDAFRRAHELLPLSQTLEEVHFPPSTTEFASLARFSSPAQRRLVFDELFFVQLGLALRKRGVELEKGTAFNADEATLERALSRLPFTPTRAQRKALDEICRDLTRPTPMNRLLQGDVGSGKTAVAIAGALIAVENGFQAALMAPTELLAEQHHKTLEQLLGRFARPSALPPLHTTLLTANRPAKDLKRAREETRSGTARIVVGTHALLSEEVEFKRLGLVIVDEQHRFGVMQRARLLEKGLKPHVLVMTATPIPRTLALTLYGDLDVSTIDELPPRRTPVTTKAFSGRTRTKAYDLVREEVARGHQAYVVLPLVEDSEKLDLRSAVEEHARLEQGLLSGLKLGLVHGRMPSDERSKTMERFRSGEIQVLVATTVIEVGVDVPNASVMLIEHAERFGLSQLHQLRGRVGRGAAKSWCLLVHEEDKAGSVARERIGAMVRTADGFELAEKDLVLRGPGEFLGTKQSGLPDLVVADLLRDQAILQEARQAALRLVAEAPELAGPERAGTRQELLRRWAGKMSLARIG